MSVLSFQVRVSKKVPHLLLANETMRHTGMLAFLSPRHDWLILLDYFFFSSPLAVLGWFFLRPPPLANGAAFFPPNGALRFLPMLGTTSADELIMARLLPSQARYDETDAPGLSTRKDSNRSCELSNLLGIESRHAG